MKRPLDVNESIPLLDRLARFARRARKPFAVESGHVPPEVKAAMVAGTITLARERGIATFETFGRAAGAFRVAAEDYERNARASIGNQGNGRP